MCICVCVCVIVELFVCVSLCVCVIVELFVCVSLCVLLWSCLCVYLCVCVCVIVELFVCVSLCVCVLLWSCLCVYLCVCVLLWSCRGFFVLGCCFCFRFLFFLFLFLFGGGGGWRRIPNEILTLHLSVLPCKAHECKTCTEVQTSFGFYYKYSHFLPTSWAQTDFSLLSMYWISGWGEGIGGFLNTTKNTFKIEIKLKRKQR